MTFQLIYSSLPASPKSLGLSGLNELLLQARRNNSRDGITGFLIFDKTRFIQILEGEEAVVRATYDRILRDSRHTDARILSTQNMPARSFSDWAMGGYIRSPEVQAIYDRYGLTPLQDADLLQPDQIVALAAELIAFDANRRGHRIIDDVPLL